MRAIFKTLSCICVIWVLPSISQAKEWRGIVPLYSTRADVTHLLGPSPDANEVRAKYSLESEEVYIVFSSSDKYVDDCVKQLPPGVVMQIQVRPTTELRLSDLKVDLSRLRKFDSSSPSGIGYEGYIDEEEGVIYDTYKGRVSQIVYIAERKDRPLCSTYYQQPERFVSKIVDPPWLDMNCPTGVAANGRVTLGVTIVGGDSAVTPTFSWGVSSGTVVSGQGTYSIVIDARGVKAQSITATVKVGGYWGLTLEESCEIGIIKKGKDNNKNVRSTP